MAGGQALGLRAGGNSLDNAIRIYRPVPTEWVLLDIKVHAVSRGFVHGSIHMFAEDGTLMATASQSCTIKHWKLDPERLAVLTPEERKALGIK
jgi:acyl-CoA thioesterase